MVKLNKKELKELLGGDVYNSQQSNVSGAVKNNNTIMGCNCERDNLIDNSNAVDLCDCSCIKKKLPTE